MIDITVVTMPFTAWQSEDKRDVRTPTLFLGLSNQGMGIFSILAYVSTLIFLVMDSPTTVKMVNWKVVQIKAAIPKIKNIKAYRLVLLSS